MKMKHGMMVNAYYLSKALSIGIEAVLDFFDEEYKWEWIENDKCTFAEYLDKKRQELCGDC